MSYKPFTAIFDEQHGKARGTWDGLSAFHLGKLVKAGDQHSIVAEDECVPFTNCIFVAGSLYRRKIRSDRLRSL